MCRIHLVYNHLLAEVRKWTFIQLSRVFVGFLRIIFGLSLLGGGSKWVFSFLCSYPTELVVTTHI